MLSRRRLLQAPLFLSARRAAYLTPIGLTFAPYPAQAEPITIAIAVGAAIAGMIAANNRGTGGIPEYLSAILKDTKIEIGQLASLQSAMAGVLTKLAELTGEIDALLREDDVRKLHDLTLSAFESYKKLALVRANYSSDVEFRKAPGVLDDVQSYLQRLEAATAQLKAKLAYGPTTALVIPTAFFLEHSLLLLRGDHPRDIAARLQSSMEWLDHVSDPFISSSAATYRALAVGRHITYWTAAGQNSFGKALGMQPGTTLFDCVGINDGWPEHWENSICFEPGVTLYEGVPSGSRYLTSVAAQQTDPTGLKEARSVPCTVKVPARNGPHDRMLQNLKLDEQPYQTTVIIAGKQEQHPAGFNALYLSKLAPSGILPSTDPNASKVCPSTAPLVNQPSATAREQWLKDRLNSSAKQSDLDALQALIDQINLERARISFSTASLTVVAQARTELTSMIRNLGS